VGGLKGQEEGIPRRCGRVGRRSRSFRQTIGEMVRKSRVELVGRKWLLRGDPLIIDDLEHRNVNTLNRMKCSGELETLGDVVFSGTEVSSNSSLAERT
jgi:hypothetical protein